MRSEAGLLGDLGLAFRRVQEAVEARVTPDRRYEGVPGCLHGGIAAACLDEAMAAYGRLVHATPTVTATLDIMYYRLVPLDGSDLVVRAWRTGGGARRHYMRAELRHQGVRMVTARGIFVDAEIAVGRPEAAALSAPTAPRTTRSEGLPSSSRRSAHARD